jgi:hypothetical protein
MSEDQEKLHINIDLDAMVIGDLETLDLVIEGRPGSFIRFFEFLDRCISIEGDQDYRKLPIGELNVLAEAIIDGVQQVANPGN